MEASVSCWTLSTDFLSSCSSLSRMASSNWARNSAACRLMMPMYLPMVRSSAGRSFGPMTSSATMPRISSLLEVMSNISSTQWRVRARPTATDARKLNRRYRASALRAPARLVGFHARGLAPSACAPSRTFGGSSFLLGSAALAASSSSAMPFLKLLMPLATSPMIDEILPLPPNISSATARNSSQCHTLRLPMSLSLLFAAEAAFLRVCTHYRRKPPRGQVCHTIPQLGVLNA